MITIISAPQFNTVAYARHLIKTLVKSFIFLLRLDFHLLHSCLAGGHIGVTRSLVKGLSQLNIPFNINPKCPSYYYPCVINLSSDTRMPELFSHKKSRFFKYLLVGPNVAERPLLTPSLYNASIDLLLTPSEWVANMFRKDLERSSPPIAIWPAGVDTEFFRPSDVSSGSYVVIYLKQVSKCPLAAAAYRQILTDLTTTGIPFKTIVYGRYSQRHYKHILNKAQALIFISCVTESQGLALAEAWAMDVPTVVYRRDSISYPDHTFDASSAPYLSESTGIFITNGQSICKALNSITHLHPRTWVMSHMSDLHSVTQLLKLIQSLTSYDMLKS